MRWQRVVMAMGVLVFAVGAAAPASAKVEIRKIAFNPTDKDSGTNKHLNKEWVFIRNTGSNTRSLDGWKLHDKGRDHRYVFGEVTLEPGDYLWVHTGTGDDGGGAGCPSGEGGCTNFFDLFWDLEHYVWNNTGDVATLRKASGKVVDRCRYGSKASSPKRC